MASSMQVTFGNYGFFEAGFHVKCETESDKITICTFQRN